MKGGRFQNTAYLRTLASKQAQNFATRRLIRDMKDMEENLIPTINVSAMPLEDDLFTWHANLLGPKDSLYEGSVYHIEISIPESYPMTAPKINFMTPIHHPNAFINPDGSTYRLCMDLTEAMPAGKDGGWSSAYSILSILVQLQSFLLEGSEKYQAQKASKKDSDIDKIQEYNMVANDYKCTTCSCKHKGKGDPWPRIKKVEEFKVDEDFKTVDSSEALYEDGLRCFHSKMGLDETHLGIGLKVTTIARNGEINQCQPILDYISLKSFYKNGIRRSVHGETFGYWLPLYFKLSQKEKTLALAKKALSFICTNNSNRFEQKMVGKVILKCISTTIMKIIEQKRHPSVLIIRHLLNFHTLLLMFVREYPEIVTLFDQEIEKFISSEDNRIKKNCPNLALIMVYLLFSEKYQFKDVVMTLNDEQLDRQVFWILKKIPELEDDSGTIAVDENRVRVTFNSQIMGYLLVCFYHDYIKILREKYKTWNSMLEHMENHCCKLDDETEDKIQHAFFYSEENIRDYKAYYEHIGVKINDFEDICIRLKEAVKNSKRKKYHGSMEELLELPANPDQIKAINSKKEDLLDLIKDGKLASFSDVQWKEKCLIRWPWMRRYISFNYEAPFTPRDIATEVDGFNYDYGVICEDHIDISKATRSSFNFPVATRHRPTHSELYNSKFSWRELFIKLDFEENTRLLNYSEDFKGFYAKIPIVAQILSTVVIYISKCDNLKSGYYYLSALLKGLKGVNGLKFRTCCIQSVPYKALNNIKKGLSVTDDSKDLAKIQYLEISGINFDLSTQSQEAIYQIFELLPELTSIKMVSTNILQVKANKLITSIMTNHPDIKEIHLERSINNEEIGKSLADGIMRAKKLESVNLLNNTAGNSISNIIYNLSFAPRLSYLDASGNTPANFKDYVENLGKMISINGSIEYLILNDVLGLMNNPGQDFFKFIAENTSLKVLSLSNSKNAGTVCTNTLTWLSQAMAINAKKKGKITELYLGNGIITNFAYLDIFMSNCYYSNQLIEQWYGDNTKASKMGGDDTTYHYGNNLRILDINRCSFTGSFSYEKFKKQLSGFRSLPAWTRLFRLCPNLHSLNMSYSNLNFTFCEILRALFEDGAQAGFETVGVEHKVKAQLKNLNIEHNNICKEGAKHLKEVLKKMTVLETLNLSHIKLGVSGAYSINEVLAESTTLKRVNLFCNKYDVDGARSLAKAISKNTSIEYIDIGFNRIRDEGFKNIIKALKDNTNNKIQLLGLKSNYLRDPSFELLMTHLEEQKGQLQKIIIKKNLFSQYLLNSMKERYEKLGENYYADIYNKFDYNEEDKLKRSIWVHPFPANSIPQVYNFLTKFDHRDKPIGIVLNIRVRKGNDYPNRKKGEAHLFIEFAHELSQERMLFLASKKKFVINGVNLRVFRAGSSTYFYSPHCRVKASKTNILKTAGRRVAPKRR